MSSKPKQEKGIRLIRPGVHEVRYGQKSRTTDKGITAARRLRGKLMNEVEEGKHGGKNATFGKLLDEWLLRSRKRKSPTTLAGYRKKLVPIKAALGSIKLAKLTADPIDRWYEELLDQGTSASLILHYHRIIVAALNSGFKWDWLDRDFTKKITPPFVPRSAISPPSGDQMWALIMRAERSRGSKEYAPFLLLAALTGMRRGEICGLRWSDVDWEGATLTVERSAWQDGTEWGVKDTKTHQRRLVDLKGGSMAALTARFARCTDEAAGSEVKLVEQAYIFSPDVDGKKPLMPDTATQAFKRLCLGMEKDALEADPPRVEEWPWHLHDCRHYAATELFGAGVNPKTVAARLGHADASVTLRVYTHDTHIQASAAAQSLEDGLIPKELTK